MNIRFIMKLIASYIATALLFKTLSDLFVGPRARAMAAMRSGIFGFMALGRCVADPVPGERHARKHADPTAFPKQR